MSIPVMKAHSGAFRSIPIIICTKFAVGLIDMGNSESQDPVKPKIVNESLTVPTVYTFVIRLCKAHKTTVQ